MVINRDNERGEIYFTPTCDRDIKRLIEMNKPGQQEAFIANIKWIDFLEAINDAMPEHANQILRDFRDGKIKGATEAVLAYYNEEIEERCLS